MTTGVTVRSEIDGVVSCASGCGDGSVCAGADSCTGGEEAGVVARTEGGGAWFVGDVDVVGVTGGVGDTMATFHLNGSSCGASWICFTIRIAARAIVQCKRTETSQPWTCASFWTPE